MSTAKKNVGKLAAVTTKFTWCIDKISEYWQFSDIESPVFKMESAGGGTGTSWKLLLSTDDDDKCKNSENDNYGIYLTSLNYHEVVRATVNFQVLSGSTNSEVNLKTLDNQTFKPGNGCWGYTNYLSKRTRGYIVNDCLTIVCTITLDKFIEVEAQKEKIKAEKHRQFIEMQNLAMLFDESQFSDVVLDVQGQKIHAHKCILANRSPVFEAMFTHEMWETKNNRVEISDVSYDTMCHTILFMYRGILLPIYGEPKNKSYMNIMIAADKYQIVNLKKECEQKLSDLLEIGNIFEYLNFSDVHNASYLKEKAIEFIVDNGKEIVELPSFKKNCNELNAHLVSEVFEALVIKKRKIE